MSAINNFINWNLGWECPKCGRVYSPLTSMCAHCGRSDQIKTNDQTQPDQQPWVKRGSTGDPPPFFPETTCIAERDLGVNWTEGPN